MEHTPQEKPDRGWEEEFDRDFYAVSYTPLHAEPAIKSFIRTLLTQKESEVRAGIVEGLEGMKEECEICDNKEIHDSHPYNKGIDDAIALVEGKDITH